MGPWCCQTGGKGWNFAVTDAPRWTGFLCRDGTGVTATMTDTFGQVTKITGIPVIRDGVSGYDLVASLVEVPDHLALPGDRELGINVVAHVASTKRRRA